MAEYVKYLTKNMPTLLASTRCNVTILAICRAKDIINAVEDEELHLEANNTKRSRLFFTFVQSRKVSMTELANIFDDNSQNVTADILRKAERDDGSDKKYNFIKNLNPLTVTVAKPEENTKFDDDYYQLDPDLIGLALIINITQFDNPSMFRAGAEQDTKYMKELWNQLGYDVTDHEGHFNSNDLKAIVDRFLGKFRKMKTPMSCVVFIGSHGEAGKIVMSDETEVKLYEELMPMFTNEPILHGKPKIFIAAACQNFPDSPQIVHQNPQNLRDTIVCFPTIPGEEAIRDPYLGTWYIYTLTEVFMREAHHMELEKMLKQVRRNMLTKIESTVDPEQVPYFRNFNLKPLYFNVSAE